MPRQITNLTVEHVALSDVQRHPDNARRSDLTAIRSSLRVHGQFKPIVVQASTGYIVAGNHTHEAMEAEGWETCAVARLDVDDDQAKRIMLADNRTSDLGTYDEQSLTDLLASLEGDLAGTGYDDGDLDARLAELAIQDTQGLSRPEEVESWAAKDARTVLLTYTIATHKELCDVLDALQEQWDLPTYSAVVERLIREAGRADG